MTYLQLIPNFKKLLALTALCLLLCANAIAQDKGCTDLKKVNNLDELLYQFYVNLDSDCLFTMPLSELEEIWGIEILPEAHLNDVTYIDNPRRFKPYHSEADAFIVFAGFEGNKTTAFKIVMTFEYSKKHGTLFPNGNPEGLPAPLREIIESPFKGHGCGRFYLERGGYIQGILYYWLGS